MRTSRLGVPSSANTYRSSFLGWKREKRRGGGGGGEGGKGERQVNIVVFPGDTQKIYNNQKETSMDDKPCKTFKSDREPYLTINSLPTCIVTLAL